METSRQLELGEGRHPGNMVGDGGDPHAHLGNVEGEVAGLAVARRPVFAAGHGRSGIVGPGWIEDDEDVDLDEETEEAEMVEAEASDGQAETEADVGNPIAALLSATRGQR